MSLPDAHLVHAGSGYTPTFNMLKRGSPSDLRGALCGGLYHKDNVVEGAVGEEVTCEKCRRGLVAKAFAAIRGEAPYRGGRP